MKVKISRGVDVKGVNTGLWLVEWLEAKRDIRPNTRRSYEGHITRYLVPHLGHHPLDRLRVEHAAEMLTEVTGSSATVQRVRATLRAALADAMRQSLVTVNVAALVKLPRGKRPKALVWTTEREARWRDADLADGKTAEEARGWQGSPHR